MHEILSIGSTIVVFCLTILVLPLVRYIVISKDRQIEELKQRLEIGNKEHTDFTQKLHDMEVQLTRIGGEVELANSVHCKLDGLSSKLERVTTELGSLQTTMQILLKGKFDSVFPGMKSKE